MNESDLMPARNQPRIVWLVLALLVVAGGLFVFLYKGRHVSRQADRALALQRRQAARLRQVDPALVKWREVRQIPVGFLPTCLGVDASGRVHVAGGRALALLGGQQFALPFAATCMSHEARYIGTTDAVYVGTDGQWRALTPPLGPRAYLTAVAPAKDGLWAADSGNRQVLHLDKAGQIIGTVGKGQLIVPSPHLKVVLKPDGDLLINNPGKLRVDTYSPAGVLKSSFGKASVGIDGFCGCCNPIDIALLPDGKIVTAEKGLPRVKVYNADGTLESVVCAPSDLSPSSQPQIAVNKQGQVLVLDPPARLVRVFEREH